MELLKKLCEAPGISGYEGPVTAVIKEALQGISDNVETDCLGNVIAYKKAAAESKDNKKRK